MRMRKFEFSSPSSMAEALKLLAQNGSRAKVIAGGTDLVEPIVEALKKVYQEKLLSILPVEQDVHLCLELSGRAYVLEMGPIVKQGECGRLAQDPQIRKSDLGI
jgi:CO/xanthine dehydrogenase FAD-binding subunit